MVRETLYVLSKEIIYHTLLKKMKLITDVLNSRVTSTRNSRFCLKPDMLELADILPSKFQEVKIMMTKHAKYVLLIRF